MTSRRAFALVLAVALALTSAGQGCRKKEAPRRGGTEATPLGALNEIENLKEVLRKDPNNLQALIHLGNLYYDTNQDLLAIDHYRKALDIDPRNANVRTDMAVCYRRAGRTDKAIEELEKAIATDPKHPQSRYNLGVILISDRKDLEGGVRAWEALLENIPDYPYRDSLRAEIAKMRASMPPAKAKSK